MVPLLKTTQKKALLVAIEYRQSTDANVKFLPDTKKDLDIFCDHLVKHWKYQKQNIAILTDTQDDYMKPTKANILRELKRLVSDAKRGDTRLLWYAGHSYQVKDVSGDEPDFLDEAIIPLDHCGAPVDENGGPLDPESLSQDVQEKLSHIIIDDDLREILVNHLRPGVQLRAIFDTCTSASLLDLKHYWPFCDYVKNIKKPCEMPNQQLPEVVTHKPRGPMRRCTAFSPDASSDQRGQRTTIFPNRRGSLPIPERRQLSLSDHWPGLQWQPCSESNGLSPAEPALVGLHTLNELIPGNVISIGSTRDSEVFVCPPGLSMTQAIVCTFERSPTKTVTWKQLLQNVTEWMRGSALSRFARSNKVQVNDSLDIGQYFTEMREIYHPQLGSDSHSTFDEPAGL